MSECPGIGYPERDAAVSVMNDYKQHNSGRPPARTLKWKVAWCLGCLRYHLLRKYKTGPWEQIGLDGTRERVAEIVDRRKAG